MGGRFAFFVVSELFGVGFGLFLCFVSLFYPSFIFFVCLFLLFVCFFVFDYVPIVGLHV